MADKIRPIILDLSCRYGDPLSMSHFKAEYIHRITYEFESPNISGPSDYVVMKNGLGKFTMADRFIDGKKGSLDYSSAPFPAGKCKFTMESEVDEFRRCRVVLWVSGARIKVESI